MQEMKSRIMSESGDERQFLLRLTPLWYRQLNIGRPAVQFGESLDVHVLVENVCVRKFYYLVTKDLYKYTNGTMFKT